MHGLVIALVLIAIKGIQGSLYSNSLRGIYYQKITDDESSLTSICDETSGWARVHVESTREWIGKGARAKQWEHS